ncbi:MAG: hypothetical protein R2911_00700 [Caldilineaceae bacterium]
MHDDVTPNDFKDIDSLENWLRAHHINTTNWGRASAKTVADLWQELVLGESRLQIDPVMRLVDVTNLLLRQNGWTLRKPDRKWAMDKCGAAIRSPRRRCGLVRMH